MSFFRKKPVTKKVDLPAHWPLPAPPAAKPAPKPVPPAAKRVVNLAQPEISKQVTRAHKQLTTPVPAKVGKRTLNLSGKADLFTRPSRNVVDMRPAPKRPPAKN